MSSKKTIDIKELEPVIIQYNDNFNKFVDKPTSIMSDAHTAKHLHNWLMQNDSCTNKRRTSGDLWYKLPPDDKPLFVNVDIGDSKDKGVDILNRYIQTCHMYCSGRDCPSIWKDIDKINAADYVKLYIGTTSDEDKQIIIDWCNKQITK